MVKKVREEQRGDCAIPEVWTFKNDDVANKFQHHVQHQLPWYDTVTEFVQSLIVSYIPEGGKLYDIGASKGNVTLGIKHILDEKNVEVVAIEPAEQMVNQYQGAGEVVHQTANDLVNRGLCVHHVSVCFLSLMFMTKHERARLMTQLKHTVSDGGCVIIVDKEAPKAGYIGTALARARQQLKANQGVPLSEIAAKELSLAGVQRPIEPDELSGDWVEFFRMGEFVGWIYEK